jgi:hypothetical protein
MSTRAVAKPGACKGSPCFSFFFGVGGFLGGGFFSPPPPPPPPPAPAPRRASQSPSRSEERLMCSVAWILLLGLIVLVVTWRWGV